MATTSLRGANAGTGVSQIKALTISDADIHGSAAIALTKLAEAVIQADGGQAFTADQSMGSHNLTNVADPVNNQDAATKAWVLANSTGAVPHSAVARVATTVAGTLASSFENGDTVDGITLVTGDRILLKNQSSASENGIRVVAASGTPARASEMDAWTEVPGMLVIVEEGTANADTLWLCTSDLGGTIDSTSIAFVQLPGPSDILAGAGLTRSGQTLNVVAGDASIVANADEIHVGVSASGAISAAGALAWLPDNTTLEINTNAGRVKPGGIGETQLGAGIYLKVANKITRETPSGSINSSNTAFTLANTPIAGSEEVFLNGILQEPGAGNDYTISGSSITYLNAPITGDRLRASYMK